MIKRSIYGLVFLLCAVAGWAFGYIRLPYVEGDVSFWIGFFGGIGSLVLVYVLWRLSSGRSWMETKDVDVPQDQQQQRMRIIRLMVVLVMTILAISCFNLYQMNRSIAKEVADCRALVDQAKGQIDSIEQSRWLTLMLDVLDQAKEEVNSSSNGDLSEGTINRIVAVSLQFKSHRQMDSTEQVLSPQRGQLLLALANMGLSDSSWTAIKRWVSFESADLRKANLSGKDLSYAQLSKANLSEARLDQTIFHQADLSYSDLERVEGRGTDLTQANLKRANLKWSELKRANFSKANLDGVHAQNANWANSELSESSLKWAQMDHLFCVKCDATNANATGANFSASNWRKAVITGMFWKQAELTDWALDDAQADSAFFDRVKSYPSVLGLEGIESRYQWVPDSTSGQLKYYIRPR